MREARRTQSHLPPRRARLIPLSICFLVACAAPSPGPAAPDPWQTAREQDTVLAYETFLRQQPASPFTEEARALLAARVEQLDREEALRVDTLEGWRSYVRQHPEADFAHEARATIARLEEERDWDATSQVGTPDAYRKFVKQHPDSERADESEAALEELALLEELARVKERDTLAAWEEFVRAQPRGPHRAEAGRRIEELGRHPAIPGIRERIRKSLEEYPGKRSFFVVELELAGPHDLEGLLVKDHDYTYRLFWDRSVAPWDAGFEQPLLRYLRPFEGLVLRLNLETLLTDDPTIGKTVLDAYWAMAVTHLGLEFMDSELVTLIPRDPDAFRLEPEPYNLRERTSSQRGYLANMLSNEELAVVLPRLPEEHREWAEERVAAANRPPATFEERVIRTITSKRWDDVPALGGAALPVLVEMFRTAHPDLHVDTARALALLDPEGRVFGRLSMSYAAPALVEAIRQAPEIAYDFAGESALEARAEACDALVLDLRAESGPARHAARHLEALGWQPADPAEAVRVLALTDRWDQVPAMGEPALVPLIDILDVGYGAGESWSESRVWREEAARALAALGRDLGPTPGAERLLESSPNARRLLTEAVQNEPDVAGLFGPEGQSYLRAAGSAATMRSFGEGTDHPVWKRVAAEWEADEEPRALADHLAEGKVELVMSGAGIESVAVRITNRTDHRVTIREPAGLRFVPRGSNVQEMVTVEELRATVKAGQTWTVHVDAACANLSRPVPGFDDTFDVERQAPDSELGRVLAALSARNHDSTVRQAAVWIVTDDASYTDLGKLVFRSGGTSMRAIDEITTTAALRFLSEVGVDIRSKRIWRNRQHILEALRPGPLRDWLLAASKDG